MSTHIPADILSFKGLRVNKIESHEACQKVLINCRRDWRIKVADPVTGKKGRDNQSIKQEARDVPS